MNESREGDILFSLTIKKNADLHNMDEILKMLNKISQIAKSQFIA